MSQARAPFSKTRRLGQRSQHPHFVRMPQAKRPRHTMFENPTPPARHPSGLGPKARLLKENPGPEPLQGKTWWNKENKRCATCSEQPGMPWRTLKNKMRLRVDPDFENNTIAENSWGQSGTDMSKESSNGAGQNRGRGYSGTVGDRDEEGRRAAPGPRTLGDRRGPVRRMRSVAAQGSKARTVVDSR